MLEARTFLNQLDMAAKTLRDLKADFRGEYQIHDIIYKSRGGESLNEIFLRLRHVTKNIWGDKAFIVAIKKTELKAIGKNSIIPIKEQFDTKEEAEKFIVENYADHFEYDFEFDRTGWQYDLGKDQVDLEDIEGVLSVECKSETEEGLQKLVESFGYDKEDCIEGPSVVAIKEFLKR